MNCEQCKHRRSIPGDCHSGCVNDNARVTLNQHGVMNGWCYWPWNFDPIWVETCDGFEAKDEHDSAGQEAKPLRSST